MTPVNKLNTHLYVAIAVEMNNMCCSFNEEKGSTRFQLYSLFRPEIHQQLIL